MSNLEHKGGREREELQIAEGRLQNGMNHRGEEAQGKVRSKKEERRSGEGF